MYIYILGSAAGGGFPQWNCNCPNCHGVRTGKINAKVRTQSSIAVSENGVDWTLKQLILHVNYVTRALPTLF